MTVVPFRSNALLRHPLAAGLAALAFSVAALPGAAQTSVDTSWIQFRKDPARRLFPHLPAALTSGSGAHAPSTTLLVTNCEDDGPGSLRAAIAAAADADIVDLSTLRCGRITLETGAIPIQLDNLTLTGPGRSALAIDGNDLDRVFLHYGGGTLTLQNLTVSNGRNRATGFDVAGGGCVASAGYLYLESSTLSGCYAGGEGAYGGALYAYALTMSNSTLSGNVAYGVHPGAGTAAFGGAAFVYALQLAASTVTGNDADHRVNGELPSYDIGGGIVSVLGGIVYNSTIDTNFSQGRGGGIATFNNLSLYNSTVSGNVAATGIAGGLFLRWPSALQLNNSTITANRAGADGGGIWLNAPGSTFDSSIVFGNGIEVGNRDNLANPAAAVSIEGDNNLAGSVAEVISLPPDTLRADPHLLTLAHNGGPTRTHALAAASPAIDAGNNAAGLPFDQRGADFPRVFGAAPDIGAFEQQGAPPPVVQVPVPTLSGWLSVLLAGLLATLALAQGKYRGSGIVRRSA
ncbi:MAG: right-handed parallel beta-helix repeat-containing protein [Dokdonella sp.]